MRVLGMVLAVLMLGSLFSCGSLFDSAVKVREKLQLDAPTTTLRVGESTQVTVRKKLSWLRTRELEKPSETSFSTTSESALVVEPDGKVTCVGTYGRSQEGAWVSAYNGRSGGHLARVGHAEKQSFRLSKCVLRQVSDNRSARLLENSCKL